MSGSLYAPTWIQYGPALVKPITAFVGVGWTPSDVGNFATAFATIVGLLSVALGFSAGAPRSPTLAGDGGVASDGCADATGAETAGTGAAVAGGGMDRRPRVSGTIAETPGAGVGGAGAAAGVVLDGGAVGGTCATTG